MTGTIMTGVTEYAEEMQVMLSVTTGLYPTHSGAGRLVVKAYNEGGHNCTEVDLLELLDWLKRERPELLPETGHANELASALRMIRAWASGSGTLDGKAVLELANKVLSLRPNA